MILFKTPVKCLLGNIIRFHYNGVFFVVPDDVLSAGTIFRMSGDKVFMDYSSSLGPIDPQIFNGKNWVPALGYLDEVEQLIAQSANNELTEAGFLILQEIDLAELISYEMARDLTVSLLKEWLVNNRLKNWDTHSIPSCLKTLSARLILSRSNFQVNKILLTKPSVFSRMG